MYEPHLDFDSPPLDTPIWRYMEYWKFESLIQTQSLYFANALKMSDRFEGSYPSKSGDFSHRTDLPPDRQQSAANSFKDFMQHAKDMLKVVYLNCWHMNSSESDAMWRLYVPGRNGIAIRSTFGLLRDCFAVEEMAVQIGTVAYIDYDLAAIRPRYGHTVFLPFLHKRIAFQHEQELRAIIMDAQSDGSCSIVKLDHIRDLQAIPGIAVDIVPEILIQEIILSPSAEPSLGSNVNALLAKHQMKLSVCASALDAEPCW